jgi:hypothetical protein
MEEQSQQKKSNKASHSSEREWSNPRNASHVNPGNVFGLKGETVQENCNPQSDAPAKTKTNQVPLQQGQGGGRRGGRGRGRGRGRGYQEKRKWYFIFHKENDDHNSNYSPNKERFEAILEEEKNEKEWKSSVNHSAPAWQNPNFGSNTFANPFHPPHFLPPIANYTQPSPWQSQVFQAQNVERRPIDQHPIAPPPPPSHTKAQPLHL